MGINPNTIGGKFAWQFDHEREWGVAREMPPRTRLPDVGEPLLRHMQGGVGRYRKPQCACNCSLIAPSGKDWDELEHQCNLAAMQRGHGVDTHFVMFSLMI